MALKPHRFFWIVENELAGMARPGLLNSIENDLTFLRETGITHIFTLTENPLPDAMIDGFGIEAVHLPVEDFGVPTFEQANTFTKMVQEVRRNGGASAVHCYAGMGRTGVFAAFYLAHRFRISGVEAIDRARRISPEYLQTQGQEYFVIAWAEGMSEHA